MSHRKSFGILPLFILLALMLGCVTPGDFAGGPEDEEAQKDSANEVDIDNEDIDLDEPDDLDELPEQDLEDEDDGSLPDLDVSPDKVEDIGEECGLDCPANSRCVHPADSEEVCACEDGYLPCFNGTQLTECNAIDDPQHCGGCGLVCDGICRVNSETQAAECFACTDPAKPHTIDTILADGLPTGDNCTNLMWDQDHCGGNRTVCSDEFCNFGECTSCNGHLVTTEDGFLRCVRGSDEVPICDIGDTGDKCWTIASVHAMAAGNEHTCAVVTLSDSTNVRQELVCWGSNRKGQLGLGEFLSHATRPMVVEMPSGSSIGSGSKLALGAEHTCVSTSAGVYCWGNNSFDQFDSATDSIIWAPKQMTTDSFDGLVANQSLETPVTCAYNTGTALIRCWGETDS